MAIDTHHGTCDADCGTDPGADQQCTDPAALPALDRHEAERLATVLKAIADPTRIQLMSMIMAAPEGEACVCDLTEPLGLRQPTVSHHLRILTNAGLVSREKRGTWVWYSHQPAALDAALLALREPRTLTGNPTT